jgi:hypothetical protein
MATTTTTTLGNNPVAPALAAAFDHIDETLRGDERLAGDRIESTLSLQGFEFVIRRGHHSAAIRATLTVPARWSPKASDPISPRSTVSLRAGESYGRSDGYRSTQISSIQLQSLQTRGKAGELATVVVRALESHAIAKRIRDEKQRRDDVTKDLAQTIARDYGLQQHRDFSLAPAQWKDAAYDLKLDGLTASEVHAVTIALAATRLRRAEEQAAAKAAGVVFPSAQ